MHPGGKQFEHGGRVAREVHDGPIVHVTKLIGKVGGRSTELDPVDLKLLVLVADKDADELARGVPG